jgi:protein-tyrosine phosphatase
MWSSSWTKGITEALEKTSEVISQESKKATKGLTDALEKTGEAITQAATKATHRDAVSVGGDAAIEQKNESDSNDDVNRNNVNSAFMLKSLQMGWSTVVEGTKQAVDATREAVELERSRIELSFRRKGFYKRDLKLPLDVEALRDAEVVYVTDRIITMGHPALVSSVNPNITAERKLAAVGHLLERRHDGRFLVWNLSEMEYDGSVLNDQVMTFSFPGSPSPPLGLLLKLLVSMENWMKADDRNVAVVHCLTGKGRTSTVMAAFLCWMGEAGFADVNQALEYIARCKKISPDGLTIPSQRRYASYFKNMLDGVRPSQPPLLLRRIIMSEAPKVRLRFQANPSQVPIT